MGWTGDFGSKKEVLAHITDLLKRSDITVLATHSARSGLFVAANTKNNLGLIFVFLLERHGGVWLYKDIDETMGPYEFDCPLRMLDLVPGDGSEYSQKWRQGVRDFHAAKRKRFDVGQVVTVFGKRYKVLGMATTKSYKIQSEETGKIFRSTPDKMQTV